MGLRRGLGGLRVSGGGGGVKFVTHKVGVLILKRIEVFPQGVGDMPGKHETTVIINSEHAQGIKRACVFV